MLRQHVCVSMYVYMQYACVCELLFGLNLGSWRWPRATSWPELSFRLWGHCRLCQALINSQPWWQAVTASILKYLQLYMCYIWSWFRILLECITSMSYVCMCVCLCICMYVSVYIFLCTCICVYMSVYIYICVYLSVYMTTCIRVYISVYIFLCICICVYVSVCIYICVYCLCVCKFLLYM